MPSSAAHWYVLLTEPADGAQNMALDEALLERARGSNEGVFRIYSWARPTLSLGRHQRAAGMYDLDRARAAGVDVVRRPTGGRAVLHHREITYAVAAPAGASLRESYEGVSRLLGEALRRIGVSVHAATPAGRAPVPDLAPCFELPTRDELLFGGRKLVGSAQWRENGAFLQHGSILVDDDQSLIGHLSRVSLPPVPAPATLRQALGRAPTPAELRDAVLSVVRERLDARAAPWNGDDALFDAADRLRDRYTDDAWTWRR